MFPDVRLLIAALLTSVVALSGGFSVFAAFRVNREPLVALPAGTAPLQLVASPVAPAAWGAPFGASFRLTEVHIGGAVTDAPARAPVRSVTIAPANTWAAGAAEPAATADVPRQSPQSPSQQAAAPAPLTPVVTIPGAAARQMPTPGKASEEDAKADPSAVAATEPTGGQAQSVAQPADITASLPETVTPGAQILPIPDTPPLISTRRKVARRAIARRLIANGKHTIGTTPTPRVAQFGGQNAKFQEPIFQSSPHTPSQSQTHTRSSANDKTSDAGGPFLTPQ
jgi:hypothetical protein